MFPSSKLDQLTCKHIFCRDNCLKSVEKHAQCTVCLSALNADEIVPYSMALSTSSVSKTTTVSKSDAADAVAGVKINLLIQELAQLRAKDKKAKVLIFSQFVKTLNVLKIELENAGLKYRTLTGDMSLSKRKKALDMFQNDPPTTVFLLSIRAGAVGINLTQANFIVLLDACTNPALEAQAIGRVWRLGQKREVHIRRYIMNDSIETRILEMEAEKNRKVVVQENKGDKSKTNEVNSTNSTTTTTSTSKGSKNDPITISFKDTAVAGSIMSSTQRFRVNEFVKLFGVKNSELPDFYKNSENLDEEDKSKKKSQKRKSSSPSSSTLSKKARLEEEKKNEDDACVIS